MNGVRRLLDAVAPYARVAVVGIIGAWVALLVAGPLGYRLGPFEVELYARPGDGVTEIHLPPFGRILADSHAAPLRLTATLEEVRAPEVFDAIDERGSTGLVELVEGAARDAVARHAARALVIAAAGGMILGVLLFRVRWRPVVGAALAGFLILGATAGLARATFSTDAFLQPTYTGSLTLAPRFLGPIRGASDRFDAFRAELGRLVSGAVRAYGVVAEQPPSASRIAALHVGDLHASPVGMDLARQLAASFEVDVVVDTGDITSFNTPLERAIIDRIPGFGVPYVFVRGNHDSPGTVARMKRWRNVVVLDRELQEVAGLRVFGAADPELTPANPNRATDARRAALLERRGRQMAEQLAGLDAPPDVVAVHDDRQGVPLSGRVPLIISGHFHRPGARVIDGTIFLRTGTTGGGGFDPYSEGRATPLSAEILYFDGDPPRLLAVDTVLLNPETRDLQVRRALIETLLEGEPVPAPTTTPLG